MKPGVPDVPQTGRMAPPLPPAEVTRLLSMHHKEDLLDLFANDPDKSIRQLGMLALRRNPPDVNDSFALGDLCADRVLLDEQLRVFYVGKAIAAYRRAHSRAENDIDRALADHALQHFVEWVCKAAEALPNARNIAVALWAAAEVPPADQSDVLQYSLLELLRAYPVGMESGLTLEQPLLVELDATQAAVEPAHGILDTQDEFDPEPGVYSPRQPVHDASPTTPASQDMQASQRPEGAVSAIDLRPGSRLRHDLPQPEGDEFGPGERIEDRYEVAQVLRGGMGVVYLCYDHADRMPVAIKSFQSRFFGNEQAVKRFEQEAWIWTRLDKHPNIVQARIIKTIRERPHIFLEHVSGPEGLGSDLRSWIEHNRVRLPQALTFALHVARGMQHATDKVSGLVHRDLKPANILVTHDEVAKVTDFGLVRSVDMTDVPAPDDDNGDINRLTRGGAIVGTAPYMSPEQCQALEVDARSDIYAFGCILYEMLAGRPVFDARKFHTWVTAHLTETPHIPPDVSIDIPGELGALVLACLEKDPENRPQNWGQLVDELSGIYESVIGEPPEIARSAARMEAHELMDKGYSLTELGRAEEALDAYDEALALQPDYAWAWARKGRTLRLLARYPEALEAFEQAIEFSPDYGWAWNGKGIVLERMARYEDALGAYQRAAELKPHDVWPLYNQADILQSMGRYDDALPLLDQALKVDPMHAHSWAKRGQIFRLLNQDQDAVKAYEVALRFQPDYGWASNGLGLALKALGRHQEALTAFQNAARDVPGEVWHWYNQVETLVDMGRYDDALAPAQRAVNVDPDHAYSWAKLAQVHRYLHRYDDALYAYDRALELSPGYGWAWNGKGIVLERLGQYEAALTCYDQAAQVSPDDVWHWYNQGNTLLQLDRYEEALLPLKKAIEVRPDHARSWGRVGNVMRHLRRYEDAVPYLERALALDPDYAWAWNELGIVRERLDQREAAYDAYQRAADLDPGNPLYAYNRAELLTAERRNSEALELLEEIAAAHPDYERAWAKLGQVYRRLRRHEDAVAAYSRALEIDPGYAWAWNGQGLALNALGRPEDALPCFRTATEIMPDDVWFWYNLGDTLVALQRFEDALGPLDNALMLNGKHLEAWAKQGQILRRLGRHKDAVTAYDRALAVDPHYAWAWNGRGLALEGLGRREEALASFERAVQEDPNGLWYYTNQLDPLLDLRRNDQALIVVDQALAMDGENANLWARRGQIMRRLRRAEDAIESYERAVAIDPGYAWAYNGLGLAYAALEDWEHALRQYEAATEYNDGDVWFWHNRGEALVKLGRYPEAVEVLNKALNLNSQHEPSRALRTEARRLWQAGE